MGFILLLLYFSMHIFAFALGTALVSLTVLTAIQTFVLPRGINTPVTSYTFRAMFQVFQLRMRLARIETYEDRDRVMALFAPITVLTLPVVYLTIILIGFALVYWAVSNVDMGTALIISGSSLLTLGTYPFTTWQLNTVMFIEAMIGMLFTALIIGYLPTMYSAFSARERAVLLLEVRAGIPPSTVTFLSRLHRIGKLYEDDLTDMWKMWEEWFTAVGESHTSLAPLVFFRSQLPGLSWLTAGGVVLDTAAMLNAVVDLPHDPQRDLCIRAGYIALRGIADFFSIPYDPNPKPGDPISISQDEFDAACAELERAGVPLKADRAAAWAAFAGWRVNYDHVLLRLASLTMAPYAPWISDRGTPLPRGQRRLWDIG